ncbi:MAG: hypothetical protein HY658_02355 [Actinobacteria bacterium]|nr:hypothetical protein [Actinomycetota bacterium]
MSQHNTLRCPLCRALVAEDAEWCGQCLASLRRRSGDPEAPVPMPDPDPKREEVLETITRVLETYEAETAPSVQAPSQPLPELRLRVPGPGDSLLSDTPQAARRPRIVRAAAAQPKWFCPSCDEPNPLERDVCAVCGTPFKDLFQEPEYRPSLEPRVAVVSSLLFPGLAHVRMRRVAEGVARAVLFAWTFGTALLALLSRAGKGLGPLGPMAVSFLLAALTVYVMSAVDARRLAEGEPPVLSTRWMLYGAAALVLLSVLSLIILVSQVSSAQA